MTNAAMAALAGGFVVGAIMKSGMIRLVLIPIFFTASLISIYLAKTTGMLGFTGSKSADHLLAIGVGLIVSFLIFVILVVSMTAISDALKTRRKEG